MEVVDVEMTIGVSQDPKTLGVFLYHPNPDGRVEAETHFFAQGGEYISYPDGITPRQIAGSVEIRGAALYVSVGPLYVISPMTMKTEELAGVDRAVVFLINEPFDPSDTTEKIWMAAHLPLIRNGEA